MINPLQGNLPPYETPVKMTAERAEVKPTEAGPDRFEAGEAPATDLPDPAKFLPLKPDEASHFPATNETIMGGMDSPCYINGEVMTRRQAIERGLMEG